MKGEKRLELGHGQGGTLPGEPERSRVEVLVVYIVLRLQARSLEDLRGECEEFEGYDDGQRGGARQAQPSLGVVNLQHGQEAGSGQDLFRQKMEVLAKEGKPREEPFHRGEGPGWKEEVGRSWTRESSAESR